MLEEVGGGERGLLDIFITLCCVLHDYGNYLCKTPWWTFQTAFFKNDPARSAVAVLPCDVFRLNFHSPSNGLFTLSFSY